MAARSVSTGQIKAARALLDWSQTRLAAAAGVSAPTVRRIEAKAAEFPERAEMAARIASALELAGVEFIPENGGGPGVRLRRGREPETIALEDLNASNDE